MKMIRLGTITAIGGAVVAALALFVAGCQTSDTPRAGQEMPAMAQAGKTGKGGAQLWAENCNRCHNIRSPSIYSDAEWEVAMHHMRVLAGLTAEEHKKILEFLKSAN